MERRSEAERARRRQEREAVREAEGKGDVQGTCGTDLQLAGLLEPRRQEVWIELVLALELEARRHDRPEEGRRPQRRQGRSAEVVAWAAEKSGAGFSAKPHESHPALQSRSCLSRLDAPGREELVE